MTTPNLNLTELANQQNQYLNANATFAIIDALLQTPVISKTLTAAPGSPVNGALYIMADAWAGIADAAAGRLALYRTGAGWIVITPKEGWKKEVLADEATYRYDGTDWLEWSAGGGGGATDAVNVSIADAGGYFASDDVEGALQELGASSAPSLINPMTGEGDMIVGGASGAPERLPVGTAGQVLTVVGSAPAWADPAGGGGGGLVNFAETKYTASPNNFTATTALAVSIAEANSDLALIPKGAGALIAAVPDGTSAGGNKRGTWAVDLQLNRISAANVASGQYSAILSGYRNTAAASYAIVVGGENNSASSQYSIVVGGLQNSATGAYTFCGGGNQNQATGSYSFVGGGGQNQATGAYSAIIGGDRATTRGIVGAEAFATGSFFAIGQAQRARYVMFRATSNDTPSRLTTGGTAPSAINQPIMPNNYTYAFTGKVAVRNPATGDAAAWTVKGLIKRAGSAGSTSIVGTPTVTEIASDAGLAAVSVACVADTTNGGLGIEVTGIGSTNLRWIADIETVEFI